MNGGVGGGSPESVYQELAYRFQTLEASQSKIKEQFDVILQEKSCGTEDSGVYEVAPDLGDTTRFHGMACVPGAYFSESPYKRMLEHMGHAVYVSLAGTGEIIYWNRAAEKLFGYKEYEVVGRIVELHYDEDQQQSAEDSIERWITGKSWSGQLTLKKRTGQSFTAMVTKSPLYEDGQLVGIINVSSDAHIFHNMNSEHLRTYDPDDNHQPQARGINWKKTQRHSQPQIAAAPQLASSVSNLASTLLLHKRGDAACNTCRTTGENEEAEIQCQTTKADRPPRARAAKVLSKLHIGGISKKFMDENSQQIVSDGVSKNKDVENETFSPRASVENVDNLDSRNPEDNTGIHFQNTVAREHLNMYLNPSTFSGEYNKLLKASIQVNSKASVKSMDVQDVSTKQSSSPKFHDPQGSDGIAHGSTSSRDDSESHIVVDCEILWKDIQFHEEIGQGSFAVVYHGIWNASDVAVKVYCGNHYTEGMLLDYKKEIDIMRRLRHPNVLLFMGAACSHEKLAIVTEYLPRGSLFKTLHKSKQSLDIRRRMRMAIDVARGMNYLHHRNPPIVHRDLKSSNLLVDKSWTVKVGDFGLSKLKNTTFLTAKSGRGTPQWMAPEVLRNEPSTEKSDVFSFGVILWELVTECVPWSNLNSLQVVGVVGFMDHRLDLPENIDPQISSIISDCWQRNPEDRPSFEEIIHRMTDLVRSGAGITARSISMP
ncbi:hypothetical protein F511_25851 [Dorcoceras hygrometricum]|uniref:non-specific serine/threonine protein kinase n=1 Tax=Dorcoceras hygrometricum TaxID=472368 RepID=A0A2Z7D2Q3_9LAMI|nr:hypothetical protein F511_25851 [Dorcoceras hygrometricum]